jgi:hypothetical protein
VDEALRAEPAKEPCDYCKAKERKWTPDCEINKRVVAAMGEPATEDQRIVLPNETALFSQIAEAVYEDTDGDT